MYRNVLFRAIIENMQWGGAGRGSGETAAPARGAGAVCGTCGASTTNPYNPLPKATECLEEGPQMLTLLLKTFQKRRIKEKKK